MKYELTKTACCFVLLCLCIAAPAFGHAAPFSDVTPAHGWAGDAIAALSGQGMLSGYDDNTFRPDRPVTKSEALAICARLLNAGAPPDDPYTLLARETYGGILAPYHTPFEAEAAYLLYRAALTPQELDAYLSAPAKNAPLLRHEAAYLLAKLMGGEAGFAMPSPPLAYQDKDDIPPYCQKHVSYLSLQKVMTGTGADTFSPNEPLTRAMMAVLVHRAQTAMKLSVKTVVYNQYDAQRLLLMASFENETVVSAIPVDKAFAAYISAKETPLGNIPIYTRLRLHYQGVALRFIEGISGDTQYLVAGFITEMSETPGGRVVSLSDRIDGEKSLKFTLSPDCYITIDGGISAYKALSPKTYVEMNVEQEKVMSILGFTTITNMRQDMHGLLENLFQHYN